jgi:ferredoxin
VLNLQQDIDEINRLLVEIVALGAELQQLSFFRVGRLLQLSREIATKRTRYQRLLQQRLHALQLHRTCKACGGVWQVSPTEAISVTAERDAILASGPTHEGDHSDLIARAVRVNSCPECGATEFQEVWCAANER